MSPAQFVSPRSLDEAVAELAGEGAVALGGGAALALLLKERLVEPAKLVYLAHVAGLSAVEGSEAGELRLGATATLRQLARAEPVRRHAPVLAQVAAQVGNPRVRAVATVGGTLAHADPRQDLPPVLLALGARVHTASREGQRQVPLSAFLRGFMETDLAEGELIVEVVVPAGARRRSAYQRFAPASQDDFATLGVAASLETDEDGTVARAAVALGGVVPRASLVEEAAGLVGAGRLGPEELDEVARAAAALAAPIADRHGSVGYKREMVRVHTRRALQACLTPPSGAAPR